MPVILKQIDSISPDLYGSEKERKKIEKLIRAIRVRVGDDNGEKNSMDDGKLTYTDSDILGFVESGLMDINSGEPSTSYTLISCPDEGLVVSSAVVSQLINEGMVQLKNNLQYSEAGLSVNLSGKSQQYQSWIQTHLQSYSQQLLKFKDAERFRGSVRFHGVSSEFSWRR